MKAVSDHLKRYPSARQSTLIILQRKSDMMQKLRDEIQAEKRRKPGRVMIEVKSWMIRAMGWRK